MLIIQIQNDGTGTEEEANYTYTVLVNTETIASGVIKGHNRADGWQTLVEMMLWAEDEKSDKTPVSLADILEPLRHIIEPKPTVKVYPDPRVPLSQLRRGEFIKYRWENATEFQDAEPKFIKGRERTPEDGARAAAIWDAWYQGTRGVK